MTYYLQYTTPGGATNVLPYGDKDLATHAAHSLRKNHNIEPLLYINNGIGIIQLPF
jgi:hypothetical protein